MANYVGSRQVQDTREVSMAREQFRQALLVSHRTRDSIGDLESAAAHFCQELRKRGFSPESMLIEAKQVIEEAIAGDDRPLAERAVLSCIQHYYRE
jgi:class 3 adenylate cyclase